MIVHVHPRASYTDTIKRLKRVEGHLRNVIVMVEAGRPFLDAARYFYDVERALGQAKHTLFMIISNIA